MTHILDKYADVGTIELLQRHEEKGAVRSVYRVRYGWDKYILKSITCAANAKEKINNASEELYMAIGLSTAKPEYFSKVIAHESCASPDGAIKYFEALYEYGGRKLRREGRDKFIFRIIEIAYKTLLPLNFLVEHFISHCDIKPDNIVIKQDGTVKVIDFGVAKQYQSEADLERSTSDRTGFKGCTPPYFPPELFLPGEYCPKKIDVYCWGTTIYQLATGKKSAELQEEFNKYKFMKTEVEYNRFLGKIKRDLNSSPEAVWLADQLLKALAWSYNKRPTFKYFIVEFKKKIDEFASKGLYTPMSTRNHSPALSWANEVSEKGVQTESDCPTKEINIKSEQIIKLQNKNAELLQEIVHYKEVVADLESTLVSTWRQIRSGEKLSKRLNKNIEVNCVYTTADREKMTDFRDESSSIHDMLRELAKTRGAKVEAQVRQAYLDVITPSLCLEGISIGDLGAEIIASVVQAAGKRAIRSLNLQSCQIGTRGMKALAMALANQECLKELRLGNYGNRCHNLLQGEGAAALAGGLSRIRSLEVVELSNCTSDGAAKATLLNAVQYNTSIKEIRMDDCDPGMMRRFVSRGGIKIVYGAVASPGDGCGNGTHIDYPVPDAATADYSTEAFPGLSIKDLVY